MPPYNETGHAKNVGHFEQLKASVITFGAAYNPARPALKIAQLETLFTKANDALIDVMRKNTVFNNFTNDRADVFHAMEPLAVRVVNAIMLSDASAEKIKDAKGYLRKIHGKKAGSSKVLPVSPEAPAPVSISSSQQSYDQQVQHFAALVDIAKSEPTYLVNESELKIAALDAKVLELKKCNTNVSNAHAVVSKARDERNKVLYAPATGLVNIAKLVKLYVKLAFKVDSAEYARIKGLEFRKVK